MNWQARTSLVSMLLLPFVLAAAGVILVLDPFTTELSVESDPFFREAPQLGPGGHLLIAGLDRARIVTADRPHDPEEVRSPELMAQISRRRVFHISTNSVGFRGPEIPGKTGFRVLCIGESVTFGWGVSAEESYPARLAKELGVEVINAGIPAMRPVNIAAWLQAHVKEYQPDLVLFTARPDWGKPRPWDTFFRSLHDAQRASAPAAVGLILPPISNFDVRGRAKLDEEIRQLRSRLTDIPWLDLTPAFRAALPEQGVSLEVSAGMHRMIDLSTGDVIAEGAAPGGGPGTPALAPEIVEALERDHGLREPLIFDGAHPDAEGFRLFASEVAQWIRDEQWLP